MSRHWLHWTILIIVFFALAAAPTPVESAAGPVGVRIPVSTGGQAEIAAFSASVQSGLKADRVIDYGSFLWAVMQPADLAGLDAAGVGYQTIENPYTLNLGGQSFDPLEGVPSFGLAQDQKTRSAGEPGLHLVQFHGPIKDAWLDDLEQAGLELIQYIHPFTYVVWGNLDSLSQARGQSAVRWVGDFLPAYALASANRVLNSEPLLVKVMIMPQAGLDETVSAIEALGGQTVGTASGVDPAFDLATFLIPGNQLNAVSQLPGTYAVQPVPLDGGDRSEMSNQVNVGNVDGSNFAYPGYQDWLDSVGLSGEGVIIANVDSGIDITHPDLASRMLPCIGSSCGNGSPQPWASNPDHATHTAGIMAADGSSGVLDVYGFLRGLGMAPSANLIEQVYYPTYTNTDGMLTLMTQSYHNGAVVSGNSWGPSDYPLGYDEDTRLVDIGVRDADPITEGNQPLSYVLSIMNGYGNPSSQGTPDEAKNIFTIGATVMQNASGVQYTNINDLASVTGYGPALDGRTIPHLVAPGCDVDSTVPGGYGLMCGTSMASPSVTGSVALFVEKYRNMFASDPSPALVKATFLPVAYDLAGNRGANGEVLGHPFDSKQGWGRLNANAVLQPGEVHYYDQEVIFDESGETWSFDIIANNGIRYLKIMLVWTDAPGNVSVDPSTHAWNNNLDLSLSDGTNTYYGNNFGPDGFSTPGITTDLMNNTEGIFLPPSEPGTYTVTVHATNINSDGVPNIGDSTDQDFALVYYVLYDPVYFPIFFR
jgi:serine protease AprX